MAKLKPWYHVVNPRADLRENRPLDASEFAVHLDHVRFGRAHEDYTRPERFFDRTFMTKALLDLCSQVVRRLSGIKVETSAVFNMATQFGGGKTHALTALYHLARGGDAAKAWTGVDEVLKKAQVLTVEQAAVATFVGTEFDVIEGRGGDGEPVRRTPWGDIAWQLGGAELFKAVAEHDEKMIAPGGDVIRKMLPDGPALILMDELLNYVSRGRKLGLRDALYSFVQNLGEEARARDNVVLCASIPASELEMNPDDQRDHEAFKKLLDRLGRAIMMAADTETAEIVRRRLFEWNGLPEDGRRAADEYADWAVEHAIELSGVDPSSARAVFAACYPFHPAVLSVFERKWQTLPRFQRTRGVLRLLALWVAHAFQEDHRRSGARGDHLIGLGSAPVEDPTFRAAVFEQLGSSDLEGPVTTDIAGKPDAWAKRLDREASDDIKKGRLHQKVATTILFESNGGQTRHRASVPEIKTAVGSPDLLLPNVDTVLDELIRSCYYLSQDGNYYKFSLSPNLNKVLTDRRAGVAQTAVDQTLKSEIEKQFREGVKKLEVDLDLCFWPEKTKNVPDRPELVFVVLGPDTPADEKKTQPWMEQIVREHGTSGRTMKSALIFVVPEAVGNLTTAVRDVLAWEEIDDDDETKSRLDDAQRRQLTHGVGRAKADLKEAIWRAYRRVYLLDKNNALKGIDLGQVTSSQAPSMLDLILNRLVKDGEVSDSAVRPNRLVRCWPPAREQWSTTAVRDAFYSSPAMARLQKAAWVKRSIADGVTEGLIGYARESPTGGVTLEKFKESMPEADVEIADDVFILKAEDARKLLDPPKLAQVKISPEYVTVIVGEKATFSAEGLDQYGQPFKIGSVDWESTGGTIGGEGEFSAGADAGAFVVKARTGNVEGSAQVRVAKLLVPKPGEEGGRVEVGQPVLRWSGSIPPQKWMNFYTKVVSRYASDPKLRLTVTFEVPVAGEEAAGREQDARTALRELGLSEDARST